MARRKRVGAMSTGATIALVGAGVVLLYLVMNKSAGTVTTTATTVPAGTYIPGYGTTTTAMTAAQAQLLATQSNNATSTTNTEVNDASNTVNNLINSIFS